FNAREIASRLEHILNQEKIAFDKEALLPIAERGEGSLRDAISLLDQTLAFSGQGTLTMAAVRESLDILPLEVYNKFAAGLRQNDIHLLLNSIHELSQSGANLRVFRNDLLSYMRTMVLLSEGVEVYSLSKEEAEQIHARAAEWDRATLIRVFQQLFRLNQEFGQMLSAKASELKMSLEIALVDLVARLKEPSVSQLVQKIERLKTAIEKGEKFEDAPLLTQVQSASIAVKGKPSVSSVPENSGVKKTETNEEKLDGDASTLIQKAFLAEEVPVSPETQKMFEN
ncbi:MAG TPA: hypothetical protein PLY93_08715, partial [Turneriella sp.]|nr:hypothetical protein [Turneriella sp.]